MNAKTTISGGRIAQDLVWMDMLKGIAIVGVVFDHWVPYWASRSPSTPFYSLLKKVPWGSPVHLFFLLSGFGLMMSFMLKQDRWSWGGWIWRRITKIAVPYWLAVLFAFALGVAASHLFRSVHLQFSWKALLACLTFARNFVPASWPWNVALWFMPIIVGLYVCFPPFAYVLKRRGPWTLLAVAVILTYGSIFLFAFLSGRYRSHEEAIFLFFIIQFALGMILAHVREGHPRKLDRLIGFTPFAVGAVFYMLSWGLRTYVPNGRSYNDGLTTVGVFLLLLNVVWIVRLRSPLGTRILRGLGKQSYLIFLLHYPIMAFAVGPLVRIGVHPAVMLALGLVFVACVYALCALISGPMDRLTSRLYGLLPGAAAFRAAKR